MKRTKPKLGRSLSSLTSLSISFNIYSGTPTCIFLAIYLPKIGPATIAAGIPAIIPYRITFPRSAPTSAATATGPGVGGTNACVTARPANNGIP